MVYPHFDITQLWERLNSNDPAMTKDEVSVLMKDLIGRQFQLKEDASRVMAVAKEVDPVMVERLRMIF